MKISVIVCTYNRCETLKTTLLSLVGQSYDGSFDYEIIVVDNNSNDKTQDAVEAFARQEQKIKYVFETKQGLSNARNAGIKAAQGEILAFTDDDIIADPCWISNIAQFSSENNFDALGGKVDPLYPQQTPAWIKKYKKILCGPILSHDQGETVKPYTKDMVPFVGANMIIKKSAFDELGLFHTEIGSGKGSMGEDTELFLRLRNAGKTIIYNPAVLIHHPVEKQRMSLQYIAQWSIGYGIYKARIFEIPAADPNTVYWFKIPRYLFKKIGLKTLNLALNAFNKEKFLAGWIDLFNEYGRAIEFKKSYVDKHCYSNI